MREFALLFGIRLRSFLNSLRRLSPGAGAKSLSTALIFAGFAAGVFVLTRSTTAYLLDEVRIGHFLFHRFLSMLLYVLFLTVNMGNMIVSYATLYRSQEVALLMTLPVPSVRVFILKFVDNFFYSSTTLALVSFAVLFGYGSHVGLSPLQYFVIGVLVLGPFMLIAGLSAVLVLMSLISIATRVGIRVLLTAVVGVYCAAVWLYFRVVNPMVLVQEVMKEWPNVDRYFAGLDPPFVRLLPSTWVSEYLYWIVTGQPAEALPYLLYLFLAAGVLVLAALAMARRHYYRTWLAANDAHAFGEKRMEPLAFPLFAFGRPARLQPATDVLLRRDFWMFFREPAQWLHLVLLAVLIGVFLVSVGSLKLHLGMPLVQTGAFLIVFLFDGFLVASIALRFIFPMMSLEGVAFWAVRASPVSLERLYWQKFAVAAVLLLPVTILLAVVSTAILRHAAPLVAIAAGGSAFVALTLIGVNLGAGTYFASFTEKNPIRVASSQGASLTFLGSMGYLALVVAVLVVPLQSYFQASFLRAAIRPGWVVLPLAAIGLLSVVVFWGATTVGLRSLRRDI